MYTYCESFNKSETLAPSPFNHKYNVFIACLGKLHDVGSKVPTLKVQGTVHMLNIDCVHCTHVEHRLCT